MAFKRMTLKRSRKHKKGGKLYKMKGCSRKRRSSRNKKYLGGAGGDDYFAYPNSNIPRAPNPFLAYSPTKSGGTGSSSCNANLVPANLAYSGSNSNSSNSAAYPASVSTPSSPGLQLNTQLQRGGKSQCSGKSQCGGRCSACSLSKINILNSQGGGGKSQCGGSPVCSSCNLLSMSGGNGLPYGEGLPVIKGMSYPNGLTGSPWNAPISKWPGVDGISGNHNHLSYNTYAPMDVSRQMKDLGANPPFLGGGKNRRGRKTQKAGSTMTNWIGQDVINMARTTDFLRGSAYNALNGYQAPINPMPWKDQLSLSQNPTVAMSKIKL